MSASLVRKGLEIVDPENCKNTGHKKKKKKQEVFGLIPDNHKYVAKIKANSASKVNLLSTSTKLTITEARKKIKSKEDILKRKLTKIRTYKKIIERGVTKRPVHIVGKSKKKKDKKTAFTEEDFRKFEEEYLNE
ncbi:hypothetical protein NQ317_014189 [Molorchus minor]|uniref:Active regulator of SIRT1 n=1 Tax=Molorchus minor TaxID=1323400 RepID=A0ABQ9JJP0_9CUCU|nr:hypothetical protein NQ317_014189 [Molorchus minor]